MFYPRDIYCIMLYCFSLSYSFCLAIHSAYFIKRFSLLTAMMSNKLLGLGLGLGSLFALCIFNVNLWLTGLDTVVHSSCLVTISRSLQFVAKSFPNLLRLINICINTWQIFAVAFLWTTVHYVWWLWLRSSLVGWVVLQACFVGWVGSISYWVGLGWITENGPTSMSALSYCYSHIIQKTEIADNLRQQTVY